MIDDFAGLYNRGYLSFAATSGKWFWCSSDGSTTPLRDSREEALVDARKIKPVFTIRIPGILERAT